MSISSQKRSGIPIDQNTHFHWVMVHLLAFMPREVDANSGVFCTVKFEVAFVIVTSSCALALYPLIFLLQIL